MMVDATDSGDPTITTFAGLGSSTISDALDRLGIRGTPVGIQPLERDLGMCGRAFTVSYVPVAGTGGETVGDFIDDVPPGSVVVIDNGGRLDATVWGDLMTTVAVRNGLAGTVIDGVCRDTRRARDLAYPLYSRGSFMRTGKDRVTVAATQIPVSMAEHRIAPGDIVCGDADGVVIVPAARADEVLRIALEVSAAEEGIRQVLATGERLDAARANFGYHKLQTRRDDS
jgi:4-hydroxy-4-methyl-2-oxoglutarate aldolase